MSIADYHPTSGGLPIDFGYWALRDGRRALLTWWPGPGTLTLSGPDGQQTIAVIPNEDEIRRRLEGYPEHADTPDALGWLASALDGAR